MLLLGAGAVVTDWLVAAAALLLGVTKWAGMVGRWWK
jgi:hypothetical protein